MALCETGPLQRRALSEQLCSPGISPGQLRRALGQLRRLENRELDARLWAGSRSGSVFDAGLFAASLWQAVQEVVPFAPGRLRFIPPNRPLPIAGQEDFSLILLNLICNSLLYAGPRPHLELKAFSQNGQAVFILKDDGPGLGPGTFFPSCGGISLARKFCQAAGGSFFMENRPLRGLSVLLSLPLARAVPSARCLSCRQLLSNRLSPVFVQLSPICILPDIE